MFKYPQKIAHKWSHVMSPMSPKLKPWLTKKSMIKETHKMFSKTLPYGMTLKVTAMMTEKMTQWNSVKQNTYGFKGNSEFIVTRAALNKI
jgi:hypothetical protein